MAHRIPLGLFRLVRSDGSRARGATPPPIPGYRWEPPSEAAGRVVLLVHGLDEPGRIWDDLAPALDAEGLTVVRFDYPNDQAIGRSADLLLGALGDLAGLGCRSVDLVAHSMGGLVSRDVLTRGGAPVVCPRLVTVGTPNAGSSLAKTRWIAEVREQFGRWIDSPGWLPPGSASPRAERGGAGRDLMPGSAFLTDLNARGLPAGTRMTVIYGRWWPFAAPDHPVARSVIEAFGDGVVPLSSARLAGVEDQVLLAANHRTMLRRLGAGEILRARRGRPATTAAPPAIPVILDRLLRGV